MKTPSKKKQTIKLKIKDRHARSNGQGQGMNWIRKEKRLAIYMRDGMACAYCSASVEDGTKLTLDHLKPHSKGGGHEATNLVTACFRCNSSRGDRPVATFACSVASYVNHGTEPADILAFIRRTTRRKLDITGAKELIARRGSFLAATSPEAL